MIAVRMGALWHITIQGRLGIAPSFKQACRIAALAA